MLIKRCLDGLRSRNEAMEPFCCTLIISHGFREIVICTYIAYPPTNFWPLLVLGWSATWTREPAKVTLAEGEYPKSINWKRGLRTGYFLVSSNDFSMIKIHREDMTNKNWTDNKYCPMKLILLDSIGVTGGGVIEKADQVAWRRNNPSRPQGVGS